MKEKYPAIFCVLLTFTLISGSAWAISRTPTTPAVAPDRVLVKFVDGVDSGRIAGIIESERGTVKRILTTTGVHIIILPEGVDVSDAVERFSSYPEVQYAEPVRKASPLEEK